MTTFECQYKCVIGSNNKDNPKFDINTIELVDILYRRCNGDPYIVYLVYCTTSFNFNLRPFTFTFTFLK